MNTRKKERNKPTASVPALYPTLTRNLPLAILSR